VCQVVGLPRGNERPSRSIVFIMCRSERYGSIRDTEANGFRVTRYDPNIMEAPMRDGTMR